MRIHVQTVMVMIFLAITNPTKTYAQCASNMGFDNGVMSPWITATDSNYITPGSRIHYKPGLSTVVVGYGSTDQWLGTISKPNALCGNYLTRVGNKGLKATADTVYRTYIIDSLSDKLTIFCRGVSEIAHNYWGLATIEAPGFGYEIYVNGKKLDCLKGSFFCGNQDVPYVWNVGNFKDTATVRKTVGWAKEELNFACFVGDTVEVRLFTRDCIKLGHYAYAFFDVLCGDTTKPVITKIMVNDIIDGDKLNLYCTNSTTLYLKPNTNVCPVFRSNVNWTPASFIFGSQTLDSAKINMPDSGWVYAEASFSNFCSSVNVRDSIFIKKLNADPHDNIPKLPRNYCDCYSDTLDFGTTTVTSVKDQNGNSMTLTKGLLILQPCDNFYEESYWKTPSSKIVLRKSQIGTVGWINGTDDGAIGQDSILATGTVRFVIDYVATKKFYVGINDNSTNNAQDMSHYIYYNGGVVKSYYNGGSSTTIGTYTGTITVDFRTLSNRKVELWINGTKVRSYSNSQKANFPAFADFSAVSNDTSHVNKTLIFGPTQNIKNFTRLYVPTVFKYSIAYTDRCGVNTKDTIKIIPGYTSTLNIPNNQVCGLTPANINVTSSSIMDDIIATTDGYGAISASNPTVTYTPVISDYGVPVTLYITSISGRCSDPDTGILNFHEVPVSNAGPDISSPPATFVIGGSPAGACTTCSSIKYAWTPKVALNDSSLANPTATKSQLNSNFFLLKVTDPVTGCFSRDSTIILTPLPLHQVAIETDCLKDNILEFKWSLIPSDENYSFGIEYSIDNGKSWLLAGNIDANLNTAANELMEYAMSVDKIKGEDNTLYRFYTSNYAGDKKSVAPIDVDCRLNAVYNVYPNPFNNMLGVDIIVRNSPKMNITIQIFNQYGQSVYKKDNISDKEYTTHFKLEGTDALTTGIYFLQITNNDNIVYNTKITKME